jgi:lysyl-tRNA synthetase class II
MQEAQSKTKEVKDIGADSYAANYGVLPMNRSQCDPEERFTKTYQNVTDLDPKMEGQTVRIRGRAQNIRAQGKSCFIVMREIYATVQCIIFEQTTSK